MSGAAGSRLDPDCQNYRHSIGLSPVLAGLGAQPQTAAAEHVLPNFADRGRNGRSQRLEVSDEIGAEPVTGQFQSAFTGLSE